MLSHMLKDIKIARQNIQILQKKSSNGTWSNGKIFHYKWKLCIQNLTCVKVQKCIWEPHFQIDHFIVGSLPEQVYMLYCIKHIKLSSVAPLYSPLCLKHCFSSCLFKTFWPSEYNVSSDWSAYTGLSQHCQQQQSSCVESILECQTNH